MSRHDSAADARVPMDVPWGAMLMLVVLAVLFGGLARLGAQPLSLELYGALEYTRMADLDAAVQPALQEGFFSVESQAIQTAVGQLPWVATVRTERLWPDRLAMHVKEHTPVAQLADGGVLTAAGSKLDVPTPEDLALPVVRSHPSRLADMVVVLREMAAGCAGCRVERLILRPGNQLALHLNWDGQSVAVELGRPDWERALHRLTTHALPVLRPRLADVRSIDMRHRHAYAVQWQPAADSSDTTSALPFILERQA